MLPLKPPVNISDLRLTLFASDCYSRRVPIGRGFSAETSDSWDCPSSLARVGPPQPNVSSSSPLRRPRIRHLRGMILFDDTAHNSESTSTVMTEAEPPTAEHQQPDAPETA